MKISAKDAAVLLEQKSNEDFIAKAIELGVAKTEDDCKEIMRNLHVLNDDYLEKVSGGYYVTSYHPEDDATDEETFDFGTSP